jgi:hypothetical protein
VTDSQGRGVPAGWYDDPSGQAGVRWWDGAVWTAHTAPRPAGGPAIPAVGRPRLDDATPVYTPFIWLVVFLPLLSTASLFFYRPTLDFAYVAGSPSQALAPLRAIFTPGYFIILATGLVLYGLSALFAFLDHRALVARGVVRPFAWPWVFLAPAIYIIGRSVIVRQVARPRGLAPIWGWIAVMVVGFVVSIVWQVILYSQLYGDLSSISRLSSGS